MRFTERLSKADLDRLAKKNPDNYKGAKVGDRMTIEGPSVPPEFLGLVGEVTGVSERGIEMEYKRAELVANCERSMVWPAEAISREEFKKRFMRKGG